MALLGMGLLTMGLLRRRSLRRGAEAQKEPGRRPSEAPDLGPGEIPGREAQAPSERANDAGGTGSLPGS